VVSTPPPLKLHNNTLILEYKIVGLKKTHPQIILEEITTPLNSPLKDFNQEELIQKLKEKNIFETIGIFYELKEKGIVIEIVLKEKTTLLILPFFAGNSHSLSGGLFLIESNFLGRHKQLFLGGVYSSRGFFSQLAYIDPSFLQSPFSFHTALSYRQVSVEDALLDERVQHRYKTDTYFFYAQEGVRFFKHFFFSITQRLTFLKPYEITLGPPLFSQKAFLLGGQWQYKNLYFYDFTHSGTYIDLDLENAFKEKEHGSWQEVKIKVQQMWGVFHNQIIALQFNPIIRPFCHNSIAVFHNQIIALQFNGEYASKKPLLFSRRIGGGWGFKTLPSDLIASSQYFSFLGSWEFPLLHFSWGTFTSLAFYEVGRFKDFLHHWQTFYGPGAGFRVYLKKVAFPAVGMDVAFNQKTKGFYFSVSMGLSR